jgi:hypothetical protein
MRYGPYAGKPVVMLKLSKADSNSIDVTSLEKQYESYGWKSKLNSGFARLYVYGHDPFAEEHREALEFLFDVINPRFVDFEIDEQYADKIPPRNIKNKLDTITFRIDASKDGEYNTETIDEFASNAVSYGDLSFLFEADSISHEQDIIDFSYEYPVYDSDIWVYPKGRKMKTTTDNFELVESICKRNTWNVSPRTDLLSEFETEEE